MGEGRAGCNTRLINDYADCDRYGTVGVVAIKLDGRYCWECIPDDELAGPVLRLHFHCDLVGIMTIQRQHRYMPGSEDDRNDTSESAVMNPFATESLLEAAVPDFDMTEIETITAGLAEDLPEAIDRIAISNEEAAQIVEDFGRIQREELLESISEPASCVDGVREAFENYSVEPITTPPTAAIETSTPAAPKRERLELSPEEAKQLLEESGAMVSCDGCGHSYLKANAHRMITNEGGERLCGRCRDAFRGIQ